MPELRYLVVALVIALAPSKGASADAPLEALIERLASASFSEKAEIAVRISESGHERGATVLQALLEGRLYARKSDKRVVIAAPGRQPEKSLSDAVTGNAMGNASARTLKKVRTNNRLRKTIRTVLAELSLDSSDPNRRLLAARTLLEASSETAATQLRAALEREKHPEVREAIAVGLATIDIRSEQAETRLGAIAVLSRSLRQEVLTILRGITDPAKEKDGTVREAAKAAVAAIESRLWGYAQLEKLFFGLSLGSVLLLAAIGLAVTFGVMGVINMAHGEMVMLGAYTTYVVQVALPNAIEYSLLIAIPAAFLVSAGVGVLIERGVIRFLYNRPLETLLATFGISLILQQTVRSVFSPLNRSVSTPQWMSGALELNSALSLTYTRLYIIVFALVVLIGLAVVLKRTRFGLEVRAVTQNRGMAQAMGVRTWRVDAMTFGLGSGIAGIAGVALSQLTNVGPNMGQAYIVDSFLVVVFGGVGNLLGTFFGAMSLGVLGKFLEPAVGSVLAKILVLIGIILFIQRRPQGLFTLGGRSVD